MFRCFALCLVWTVLTGCASTGAQDADPALNDRAAAREAFDEATERLHDMDYAAAREALQRALRYDPSLDEAYNNLGLAFFFLGDDYLAAKNFDEAARRMPASPQPQHNLGLILERAGRLDEAIAYYTEANRLDPDQHVYMGSLARARRKQGDDGPALREMLGKLAVSDPRADWRAWAQAQLRQLPE